MKTYILGFCTLFIALISHAQTTGTCTLTGDIKGLGNHLVFIDYSTDTTKKSAHHDSLQAHHGHFVYQTHLDEPVYASVSFHKNHKPLTKTKNGDILTYRPNKWRKWRNQAWAWILLENRDMHWHTRLDSMSRAHIDNAPMNDTVQYYENLYNRLWKSDSGLIAWRAEWKKWRRANGNKTYDYAPEGMKMHHDSLQHAILMRNGDSIAAYILSHPSSQVSARIINHTYSYPYEKRQALYAVLANSLKASQDMVYFKKHLDLGPPADVRPGHMAPDISLPDTAGRNIALSSLRGKYVLLNFWYPTSEWSRKENQNFTKAYKQLHPKGLEIFSVAIGDKKDLWKKAIARDKTTWTQVSELTWESKARALYETWGWPSTFLIDPSGKILSTNIRGKNASKRLARLMK